MPGTETMSSAAANKKRKIQEISSSKKENDHKALNSKVVANQQRGKSLPKVNEPKKVKKSSPSKEREEDAEIIIGDNDDSAVKALKNGLFSLYGMI